MSSNGKGKVNKHHNIVYAGIVICIGPYVLPGVSHGILHEFYMVCTQNEKNMKQL